MKTLSETWFVDGYIDFELKKYKLLAYLQEIIQYFSQSKLYPQLSDIIFHYNNLVAFKENKQFLQQFFPKRLSRVNLDKLQLTYQQMIEDDDLMKELESILQYSLKKMEHTIQKGTGIYEFVAEKLTIFPVGIVPLDNQEGYMFISNGPGRETKIFQYRMTIFEKQDEKYRGIHTYYLFS
ncbi:MAG: hypothetical protein ACYCOO_10175, partial [Chitinophagaceae bacterium]